MEHIFKRKLYDKMLDWKQSSQGRSALLIQGARRVGKSTIAEQFAKNEYESHILIDFSKCSKDIRNIFDDMVCIHGFQYPKPIQFRHIDIQKYQRDLLLILI